MNRRKFIQKACGACVSGAVIGSLLSSCKATHYATGRLIRDGVLIDAKEFKVVKNGVESYRPYIILRNDALQYPICLYRWSASEYSALWMQCSHQGAELQVSGDFLQCPAHGSEFNKKGVVTSGPASADLRSFPVTLQKDELFIDLRKQ